ncbi:uncharacterized protein LOC128202817 [Mya arenaria]|uniref:uncharacterized protein LOC128202817 n=1 Tax=Mya arenaria TaxID=6604 RepID=UPI0022E3CBDB|nr:uncharacterized protein LOC128202817 [Mya arenaria]
MYSQFANEDAPASARSSSANRTKLLVNISAWATRTLAFLSIIFAVVAFTMLHNIWFGAVMCATAVFSISSPLNFNACCYSDCSRNTSGEKRCGLVSVFVWMFLTNMVYMILFAYSWVFWLNTSSWSYSEDWLNTVFAFTLIINLCLSIFNLYSMCLVYKFGCCFMNGVDRECPQQSVNMVVVNHSQLSTIGGGVPANVLNKVNSEPGPRSRNNNRISPTCRFLYNPLNNSSQPVERLQNQRAFLSLIV